MRQPFQGVKVIDFTHVLAGPACSYYLGLLGAEVIKVERPDRGDAMRHRSGSDSVRAKAGMSTAYMTQAAGKRSVMLDLGEPRDRNKFDQLLAGADVLVENHRPETLRRLGLEWTDLHNNHPRLIHCAMTGYGRGGPLENAPAYDVNIQAFSGLMALTGTAQSGPIRTGAPVIDYATALAASFAVSAALFDRSMTGRGQFIDVSMLETAFCLMSSTITDHLMTGHIPSARGNAANSRSPSAGVFPCAEGHLSLGVNEQAQFEALATALGRSDWFDDRRFADHTARAQNGEALSQAIGDILITRKASDWEELLLRAGVPAARLRTLPEALSEQQVENRGYLRRSKTSSLPIYPGLPFQMAGGQKGAPLDDPETLGQSNDKL